jgi:hypothetical protein
MSLDFIEELQQLISHYMSERHQQDNTYGSSVGIQSLPITDHVIKSKQIKSCPTGNSRAKKRAAKKQAAILSI